LFFFFQAEDGIRDFHVTGVQTCALPIFAIPEQPLAGALQSLADQIDVQIVFFSGAAEGLTSRSLSGSFTRLQALNALLAGTGLRYVFLNADSVAIQPVPEAEQHAAASTSPAAVSGPPAAEAQQFLPRESPTRSFAM